MKVKLIILVMLAPCFCRAQFVNLKYIPVEPANNLAIYRLKYQPDSTDPSYIRNSTMLLFLGSVTSKFVNKSAFINDTTIRKFTSDQQAIDYLTSPNVSLGNVSYMIYKNYPKGKLTFTDHIPSDTYKYEEDLNLFHWTLTDDTSSVCGYKTFMAYCNFAGRSWVAWFTPELPYSDGPYKFNGLPGLIVKLYDTRHHYVFEMLQFNKLIPEIMIDIEDKEYVVTSKDGFFKAWDSFHADIIDRGKQYSTDSDFLQTIAKNAARRNNPIELKRKQIE